ncbi:MAG: hypothetical protein WD768_16940 [Phycisphaeraceae bacterium]
MSDSESESSDSQPQPDPANLLLVVVGAHLRAETADRPLAYRLVERIRAWLEKHGQAINPPVMPIVCSDIWYVNDEALQGRPTISVGGPGVNALSAYYHQKLKTAVARSDDYLIQLDPEFVDLRVSVWGRDHNLTVAALEVFVSKYLDAYLRAVATQVEPKIE